MSNNFDKICRRLILMRNKGLVIRVLLLSALALPLLTEARPPQPKEHTRYKLIDLGTLGGPSSGVAGTAQVLNKQGIVAGGGDTADPDPFDSLCFAESINDRGEITGTGVPAGVSWEDTETLGHAFLLVPVHAE